ncbi:MAG: hypothetical protein OEN20_09880, partial [Gammaproteobacteria bacterium]|nr:hypothetical protein [Gammaproteobacteria bacterium]
MHAVDPRRLDLAREYKRNPLGPHSQDLQKILKIMRWDSAVKRWIAVQIERGGPWYLARTNGPKGHALSVYLEQPCETLAQAQWAIFRQRWQAHTGEALSLDDEPPTALGTPIASTDLVIRPLLGYSDLFSVAAGECIAFKVSAEPARYSARVAHVRCGDYANVGLKLAPVTATINGEYVGRRQPIHAGSYADVAGRPGDWSSGVTLECWIWPTLPRGGEQAIIADWDVESGSGVALHIDADGAAALRLGDGASTQSVSTRTPLLERHWYRIRARVDVGGGQVQVTQEPLVHYARDDGAGDVRCALECTPRTGPGLRIAAWSRSTTSTARGTPVPDACFNGKIEAPRVWHSGAAQAIDSPPLAHWDFARDMSTQHAPDITGNGYDVEFVNVPTRAMKGVHWDGSCYNWRENPAHYAAIHFHDDDLHDCGWQTD